MAIDWQQLPARSAELPFNGDQVLLAVPNLIGTSAGGDGKMVDPDLPFTMHLARWDDAELQWATNEEDDETGGIYWVDPMTAVFWAEISLPY